MKSFDLIKLAAKTLKCRWAVLPAVGFAIASFCLCFAGAILTTVRQEKAQPYELVLAAQSGTRITDGVMAEILNIPDVITATSILQIPVTVKTGKYSAQLTLTGMDADYLDGVCAQGGIFPADSAMPYIVLNEAAQKWFAEDEKDAGKEPPQIDWMNAAFSVGPGEGARPVISKVCGIFYDSKDAEPAACISLSVAKELLRKSGQPTEPQYVRARVANIGRADAVSRAAAALGLSVTNSAAELEAVWDIQMKETACLIVIAVFALLGSTVVMTAWRRVFFAEQRESLDMLLWLGLNLKDMRRLFSLQGFLRIIFGAVLGIILAVFLPSFLLFDAEVTKTSFIISVPLEGVIMSVFICLAVGMPPFMAKKRISKLLGM